MNANLEAKNFNSLYTTKHILAGAALGGGLGYAAHELANVDEKYIQGLAVAGAVSGGMQAAFDKGVVAQQPFTKTFSEKTKITQYPGYYTLDNAMSGAILGGFAGSVTGMFTHNPTLGLYGTAGGLAAGTLYSMYRIATQKNAKKGAR